MGRLVLGCSFLVLLNGCKGWVGSSDDADDTGDPPIVDPDTGETDTDTDTDTDTEDPDTGEVNLPPSAPVLAIEPAEPTEIDDLNCVISTPSVDPEGEELTYYYAWRVDGQDPEIDTSTVSADNTWVGHVWTCYAWASDGKHESEAAAAEVVIGQTCEDYGAGEPNDSEAAAVAIGEIKDKDDPVQIVGVLNGGADDDWYYYLGRDTISVSEVKPGIEHSSGSIPVRACLFAQCLNGLGKTETECENGAAVVTSPSGLPGCCSYADFNMDLNCADTTDDEAAMYVLLYTEMEDVCEPYDVKVWY